MAITKYEDQKWSGGTPIDGEQLSSNGYYTGEKIGTPTQGTGETAANKDAHHVEHNTIRYGTIMQDAATNANMPSEGVAVINTLTGCTSSDAAGFAVKQAAYNATYVAEEGYDLPDSIEVKIGNKVATITTDYSWTSSSGTLQILSGKVTDTVEITIVATPSES